MIEIAKLIPEITIEIVLRIFIRFSRISLILLSFIPVLGTCIFLSCLIKFHQKEAILCLNTTFSTIFSNMVALWAM